jgi:isoleucyl-tRNA synthetase
MLVRPAHKHAAGSIDRLQNEILEELNIKGIEFLEPGEAFETYRLKPNLPVVGPKYGRQVPKIHMALSGMDTEQAAVAAQALEQGAAVSLDLGDGEIVSLGPEEILVETLAPEGFSVMEADDYLVALDTALDEELIAEGLARELVRQIQEARKEAGLEVSDRIRTYISGASAQLQSALEAHADYITSETLSLELYLTPPLAEAFQKTIDLEGEVVLGVVKVT